MGHNTGSAALKLLQHHFFKWQVEYTQVKSIQVSEREISYTVKSSIGSTSQWYQMKFIRLLGLGKREFSQEQTGHYVWKFSGALCV